MSSIAASQVHGVIHGGPGILPRSAVALQQSHVAGGERHRRHPDVQRGALPRGQRPEVPAELCVPGGAGILQGTGPGFCLQNTGERYH